VPAYHHLHLISPTYRLVRFGFIRDEEAATLCLTAWTNMGMAGREVAEERSTPVQMVSD